MYKITKSNSNKDIIPSGHTGDILKARKEYLKMYGNFVSKLPDPEFYAAPERDDIFILDFAKGPCGLKAFGAEKYISTMNKDLLGYASPRVGHAAEAIAYLAQVYDKKAVFFAPASQQVTPHQAVVLAYGADLRFAKIPAMPTLNAWIRKWADRFNGVALPFGLANTPLVTAALVAMCDKHSMSYGQPPEFYCSVSTGTMIRALQIGWPNATAIGMAVARNIGAGEKGFADVRSYHKTFYAEADYMPKFETTATYDAKAYKMFLDEALPGSVFINVGSDKQIESGLKDVKGWRSIDSQREWGDLEAFRYA